MSYNMIESRGKNFMKFGIRLALKKILKVVKFVTLYAAP